MDTESKSANLITNIYFGCLFRVAFPHVTLSEMVAFVFNAIVDHFEDARRFGYGIQILQSNY